jgi:hypothetical protein
VVILLVVLVLPFVSEGKISGEGGEKVRGGLIPILVVILLILLILLLLSRLL